MTRKRRAGINPRDGNFEIGTSVPILRASRPVHEKSLPSFIIARWSMKLAARPKFVLHGGAMMRNMTPDVHRFTPFQNIIIRGRRGEIRLKSRYVLTGVRRYGVMDLTLGRVKRLLFERCLLRILHLRINEACMESNEILASREV